VIRLVNRFQQAEYRFSVAVDPDPPRNLLHDVGDRLEASPFRELAVNANWNREVYFSVQAIGVGSIACQRGSLSE
jgi:hypothetical protein